MNDYAIISLFCQLDDFCNAHLLNTDPRQEMSDSEIMFTAVISARMFGGNLSKSCCFLKNQNYCSKMLSKSRFNRRLHKIPDQLWIEAFKIFSPKNTSSEYIVDSFPVPTCRAARGLRVKLFSGGQFHGYNASHKQWFIGLKVHLLISAQTCPVSLIISPGSEHDLTALKLMDLPLPTNSILYGDKAYTDYEWEEYLLQRAGIRLVAERKSNSKRPHSDEIEMRRSKVRKTVETAISGIIRLMPRWIQAVTAKGFELKLVLFVLAFASLQLAT